VAQTLMNKRSVIDSLLEALREQHTRATAAAESAAEGATGDDTKAECKYDTRGLESSYLAAGQAQQATDLEMAIAKVETFDFDSSSQSSEIIPGALIEADRNGVTVFYLLAPGGGGIKCHSNTGEEVTILGSEAPLRAHFIGLEVGDQIERPPLTITAIH
ncbi:MAG: hypothetical protein AAF226_19505, partial [Verrucomicrobiota bacterium]